MIDPGTPVVAVYMFVAVIFGPVFGVDHFVQENLTREECEWMQEDAKLLMRAPHITFLETSCWIKDKEE